jgi:D-alanyl-D-alanine carboxypeptidase (penicillin-binding protein 5/6)
MKALSGPGVKPSSAAGVGSLLMVAGVIAATALLSPQIAHAARHRRATSAAASSADHSAASNNNQPQNSYAEACVMEPVTGTVIFESNDHKPWPTASLAKMMLMLIVDEKLHDGSLKLSDQIATSRRAAEMGGSQVYLKEGESFSLDDMMKAVVVHSANDATAAVAEYLGGSTESFVTLMNQKAAALGMKDTHYYNVHGLPPARGESADVSSAYDQAILARELLKYPDTLRWSAIDTAPFRGTSFVLRNTNHLVRTYPGCDGLKTGFYDQAGFNVVATAKRGDLRLIAVVLGTPHKLTNFKEASELLSQGFLNYEIHPIAKKGASVTQAVAVTGGASDLMKPVWASDAGVFLKRGESNNSIKVDYNLPQAIAAPIKAGQQVGTAQVTSGGKSVATIALLAPTDVAKKGSLVRRLLSKF